MFFTLWQGLLFEIQCIGLGACVRCAIWLEAFYTQPHRDFVDLGSKAVLRFSRSGQSSPADRLTEPKCFLQGPRKVHNHSQGFRVGSDKITVRASGLGVIKSYCLVLRISTNR